MVSNELIVAGLLGVNIALYVPLVLAAVRRRRQKVSASNLVDAFRGLELSLQEAIPDLPAGFTWEEAFARLKSSGVQTGGMEGVLKGYEEYRYGGVPLPNIDFREVVSLANRLGGVTPGRQGGAAIGS